MEDTAYILIVELNDDYAHEPDRWISDRYEGHAELDYFLIDGALMVDYRWHQDNYRELAAMYAPGTWRRMYRVEAPHSDGL